MLGLLPALRGVNELEERAPGGQRQQKPIQRRQCQHPALRQKPPALEPDHIERNRRGVAAEKRGGKDRRRVHCRDRLQRRRGDERVAKPEHEQRVDQRRQDDASEKKLKGDRARGCEFSNEPARPPHMDEPRLYPALVPTRTLPQPRQKARRGFFIGGR